MSEAAFKIIPNDPLRQPEADVIAQVIAEDMKRCYARLMDDYLAHDVLWCPGFEPEMDKKFNNAVQPVRWLPCERCGKDFNTVVQ